jgi:hypothetical protein
MWDKCVGCGEGLFTGDGFCGNCGRPTKAADGPGGREAPGEPPEGPAAHGSRAPQQSAVPPARLGEPGSGLIRIYARPTPPTAGAAAATDPAPVAQAATDRAGRGEAGPLFCLADPGPAAAGPGSFPGSAAPAPAGPVVPQAEAVPWPADLLTPPAGGPAGPAGSPQPDLRPPAPAGLAVQPAPPSLSRTRLGGPATFDPASNTRFLLQVLRQAAIFAGIYALIQTAALLCFLLLGLSGIGLGAAMGLEIITLKVVAVILVIPFWLIPVSALLGQWTVLVEGSRDTAKETFQRMSAAFSEHEAPVDSVEVHTVLPAGEDAREYLELRRGRFRGFLSCFPHGRDLYLGWTFWLRMSPARLLLLILGRRLRNPGGGGDIDQALGAESARALVAAMHSAALAGAGDTAPGAGDPPTAGHGRHVAVRVG